MGIQGARGTARIFEGGRGKAWGEGLASLGRLLFSLVFHLSFIFPTSPSGRLHLDGSGATHP